MVGKVMHLVNRSGRYHARLVVPKELRTVVGKTELRTALGADYRRAVRLLPGAVAKLQHQIAVAERKVGQGRPQETQVRYPLSDAQLALSHYQQRLALDDELRNDPRYASIGIDDIYVALLRNAAAGRASNDEPDDVIGHQLERFRAAGNIDTLRGTDKWRATARALCISELEALSRVVERDDGDYSGSPAAPLIKNALPVDDTIIPISMNGLWSEYVDSRVKAGFMRDKGKRMRPVIESLRKFVKHDDARRLTRKDIIDWRGDLMITLSAKTVNDIYLSALKSTLAWAVENERLNENVAATVNQPKPRKVYGRERGYTDLEAQTLLKESRSYEPTIEQSGRIRESKKMVNVKRWVPILCAFTGARVSEITQLRKEDLKKVGEHWVVRITLHAGTVKYGGYRDVPLHRQIIEEGFAEFVEASDPGPLFHNATDPAKFQHAAKIVSNKLSDWLRLSGLRPKGLQPNHAWRHRLKTTSRELGISSLTIDAIQGHSGKSVSDDYGDTTLKTKINAIEKLPEYLLK